MTKKRPPSASAGQPRQSAETKALIAKGRKYYMQNYKPREMILDHGKGSRVWDLDGNAYIDFGAGIAVSGLGYHHKDMLKAITAQAEQLWHTSNIFFTAPPILLAEELVKASKFAKRAFLCNSGAEANEAAIKLARKHVANKGRPPERREILSFTGSFHGRTLATVTATAQPKYHEGFEPLPQGFSYCPFNDFEAVARMITEKTCAVISEVVQGEGGITPVAPGFLKHVQELCRKQDALLILDQVQCGMGRTGKLFSHWWEEGVEPDIVTLAKGLGGGIPVGAMLAGPRASEVFQFGSHGSTFGGNPIACSVARVVLSHLRSKELMQNVKARGGQIMKGLAKMDAKRRIFHEIRGRGLMIGAELAEPYRGKAGEIGDAARRCGLLILQAGPNVLRIVPPLVITQKEVDEGLRRLDAALEATLHP
jgi:acetylornithine/N-succinyldiaminopimelate aminotransferase